MNGSLTSQLRPERATSYAHFTEYNTFRPLGCEKLMMQSEHMLRINIDDLASMKAPAMLVVQMGLECHHTCWNVHYAWLLTHHTRFSAKIIRIQLIVVNGGGENMVPKSVIVRPFPCPLCQRQQRVSNAKRTLEILEYFWHKEWCLGV
ncbi:uncharacterized protein CIMG_05450 [Coccidioides immitis RS]|uniref:Uncharacterized protein n=1 Tax=Coccidioides immitis (strain RS) TaxID=246410 RepID=J3KFL4_COCIM|nr:uncharacterized protein CIMG_05450 [Coccidioides immitis RS]EAS34426.3 hypothetical protein CIMG_05450 [Coccidioides immitis RS]